MKRRWRDVEWPEPGSSDSPVGCLALVLALPLALAAGYVASVLY